MTCENACRTQKENNELRAELKIANDAISVLRSNLVTTQIWLLCSIAVSMLISIRSCF